MDIGLERKLLGKKGEQLAAEFLEKQGYELIERNFRASLGEIDIIARDKECLCFIEVKTRTNEELGLPQEAVNKTKIRKISQNALAYLKKNNIQDIDLRFDVVSVILEHNRVPAEIELIQDAFELDPRYFY